ncbi:MAG TPA: signal recognition particle-docking protein FtsY [Candidatus Ozemobacteraceae bacterium]|nr:signal recognition particle-docking protein FtsY [Candidatus Ozemobacteraceae bacterium]
MSEPHDVKNTPQPSPTHEWNEPRLVVLLIGLCLLIEGGLIYYQSGPNQIIIASVTALSGITLLLFAWLVPIEDEQEGPAEAEITGKEVVPPPAELRAEQPGERILAVPPTTAPPPAAAGEPAVPPAGEAAVPAVAPALPAEGAPRPALEEEPALSWYDRLTSGLRKTRESFVGKVKNLVLGRTKIDDELLEDLEATLFEADLGVKTTQELLQYLHQKVAVDRITDPNCIYELLREQLHLRLTKFASAPKFNPGGLTLFLVIGVNGVGKTTTIAKLARKFMKEGKKVMLAAGDTFRAAAIDQLCIWGERVGVEVVRGQEGGDPGALVFDAIAAAKKRGADLLIVDTAGRMHVKADLMAELAKVQKIAARESDGGPHEILLILDATTGQNAVQQAKLFNEVLPISGLVMTKLDGTAKGGVLFAVEEQLSVPVKFIGVGEKMDDLMTFDPEQFLEALFADDAVKSKESDYAVL